MTTGAHPDHRGPDLFVAEFYPRLGEYLAKQHASGYDAVAARAQFLFWLAKHVADEEPAELSARDDGQCAKNDLLADNRRLVADIAERFSDRGVPLADLIQAGTVGLERAAEKFDHTRGYRFPTYATWWIRRAIARAIADHGGVINEDSAQ
jgi:DNA-directed RNA polymerase sigma subunit (sigma70/sigma32)